MIKQRVPTLYSLLHFLFVVFLVLNCHSVYNAGVIDYHFDIVCCLLAVMMLPHIHIMKKTALIIIIYLIYQIPLILHVSSREYLLTYIIKYVVFISVIICLSQDTSFLYTTIQYLIEIVFCIALVSLFFFVFVNIFGIIQPTSKFMLLWGSGVNIDSYCGIYFTPSLTNNSITFTFAKNSAIFTEAPIWAALLSIITSFEFFGKRHPRFGHIIVFYITLFTTLSTTAYIFFILSIIVIIYQQYKQKLKNKIIKFICSLLIIGVGCAGSVIIFRILEEKSSHGISFLSRADDLIVAVNAFKEHPLIGVGFGNTTYRYNYFSEERLAVDDGGQSSDFASLLGGGGIYFISFYLFFLFKLCKLYSKNKWILFGLLIYVLLISRIGETILFLTLITASLLSINTTNNMK